VCRTYGVFDEAKGRPRRSSYVVDKRGRVRWAVHNPTSTGRDLDEHLRQLHVVADEVA
jgi:alkyl hydroperoxide reductase subunit AhpC